ncbi:helicase HerA domain-containing protein [Cellulosimicrobium composti]|uniref:ATP-binding protein n=1 Tax=Cellulosimicrobium composti TaxID=2672572 RepID=A0ABX0BAW2_9MICO|nr:ATP-binding protein [Cellulosimicrobium composti]NDO88495.1 ATP-binding protein [Cellulosimicrobium composti]
MSAETGTRILVDGLATELFRHIDGSEPGHCVRIDGVDLSIAEDLATTVAGLLDGQADVFVLRSDPRLADLEVAPEKAIELRNRKLRALLLLVPAGEGHAASSLDNSFERIAVADLFDRAERAVRDSIPVEAIRDLASRQAKRLGTNKEAWLRLLAELAVDPTFESFGANLWRVGLVPDLGADVESRLDRNRRAVEAISRPSRPAASIDERLTNAGLEEGSGRVPLRQFLDQLGAELSTPNRWAKELADRGLSFDGWKFADTVSHDLQSLEVAPFQKPDGTLERSSKLKLGSDGQLLLEVSEDSGGSLVVVWKTSPAVVDTVARWRIEVRQPEDLRDSESEPLAVATVKNADGKLRRATVKVEATADDLDAGNMFVASVTPLGPNGEEIALDTGEEATADSQWFQIAIKDAPDAKLLRRAAVSVPEAALHAALSGQDDLREDFVMWDLAGGVFGLRLGNRRSIQVRVSEILVRLQHDALKEPSAPKHHVLDGAYGAPLDLNTASDPLPLVLPRALAKARAELFDAISADSTRNTGESLAWDDEVRTLAKTYAATYKRALEQVSGDGLRDLLLLDTVTIRVKRANRTVEAAVVLPIHPLRINWIGDHDELLRSWAHELVDITSAAARSASLDATLLAQIVPANLPFTVLDADGNVAVYAEELTFGSGLYLVPGDLDRDSGAESVCTVLGLDRASSTLRASSDLVAERIRAYELAHQPGEALRALAVNPGSGELIAGALAHDVSAERAGGDDDVEPHRLEVVAYSDSAAYVKPVPSLVDLQTTLRSRKTGRESNHLTPTLSLSVRALDAVATDRSRAHLAFVQDVYEPTVDFQTAQERKPALEGLLVPIVTDAVEPSGDAKVWASYPALGPATGGTESDLHVVHRTHQRAIAREQTGPDGTVPTVTVTLDERRQEIVRQVHERADWVIGLDRYIGADLFGNDLLDRPYILDYAPDFVEGIGDRLTVTTTHRAEVEMLLDRAMTELGLANVDQSVGKVLETLSLVSGRLALRLLRDNSQAREAVSLAALMVYLKARGQLDDVIVVPVDAHQEIFGAALRDAGEARRCDLLLVRIGQRSFKIECVEVKARKEAHLPENLAERIVAQVEDTRRLLASRFFSDPPRVDSDLQRARLASLLHYYADRSHANGIIAAERIADIHRYIDRVSENRENAVITTQGYVISMEGDHGFKRKYNDTPMTVISGGALTSVGFTTLAAQVGTAVDVPRVESPTQADDEHEGAGAGSAPDPAKPDGTLPEPTGTVAVSEAEEPAVRFAGQASEGTRSGTEVRVELGQDATGAEAGWTVSTKGSPHAFILGIPGQGKSVTTRKIIRDFSSGGLPSLVFDFHGDMAADPPEGAKVLDAAVGLPFSPFEPDVQPGRPINTNAMEIAEILAHVAGLGDIQRDHVYNALRQAYAEHGWSGLTQSESVPTMDDFVEALTNVESQQAGRNAVARLRAFTDFGLFGPRDGEGFDILNSNRDGLVVDISRLTEEVQRVAASFILRKVYREMFRWEQDGTMKLAVVLDEAHRMARDVTLPKIMKEGRKYGAGVIVASQNVDDFHADVLGNAGTKIVFRTNYPASRKVSNFLRGRRGADLSQEIERLNVGVAYVSTPESAQARKVYMSM